MNNNAEKSYSDIVSTMQECLEDIRGLGNGDSKTIHTLTGKLLIDSGFINELGHIIVPNRRSAHVENFLNKFDEEYNVPKPKQRIRK